MFPQHDRTCLFWVQSGQKETRRHKGGPRRSMRKYIRLSGQYKVWFISACDVTIIRVHVLNETFCGVPTAEGFSLPVGGMTPREISHGIRIEFQLYFFMSSKIYVILFFDHNVLKIHSWIPTYKVLYIFQTRCRTKVTKSNRRTAKTPLKWNRPKAQEEFSLSYQIEAADNSE